MNIPLKSLTAAIVIPIAVTIGCFILLKYALETGHTRNDELEDSVSELRSEVQEMKALLAELIAKVDGLERIDVSREEGQEKSPTAEDNWLSFYSRNVSAMNAFLENNPQLLIPEMSLLEGDELLSAMKGLTFDCQADFNKAAARLRFTAKRKIGTELCEALKAALIETGGEMPTMDQVAAGLESAVARDALERYVLTTNNEFYDKGSFSGGDPILLKEKPMLIDDTWFSQLIVHNNGGMGAQNTYEHMDDRVRTDMQRFEVEHGRAATSFDELFPYLTESYPEEQYRSRLVVIFDELHQQPVP